METWTLQAPHTLVSRAYARLGSPTRVLTHTLMRETLIAEPLGTRCTCGCFRARSARKLTQPLHVLWLASIWRFVHAECRKHWHSYRAYRHEPRFR